MFEGLKHYELVIEQNGSKQIKLFGSCFQKGYTVVESIPSGGNGKALPSLRKQAASLAKRNKIPFIDKTI
jgi:hypothetical protein